MARRFFQATEHGDLAGRDARRASNLQLTGDGDGEAPRSRSLRSAGQSATSHRYRGRRANPTNVTVPFRRTTDPNVSYQPKDEPNVDNQETRNKATLTRFQEALSSGDWELISKTIDEVVAPDALISTPLPIEATGAELLKEVFGRLHQAFPDLHITIEDLIAEGDKVVARDTVTGAHQGEYMALPPTGKSVTYNEIFIVRFADGRIAETWGVVDVLSQLRQLGAIPGGPS
jgi:steroid delta-isomerase-like uncharacterized protein